jgi:hypothetical protein
MDHQRWISCRKRFLLPVKVLSRLFRRLFLEALSSAFEKRKLTFYGSIKHLGEPRAFDRLLATLRVKEWHLYSKPPFGGPEHVLDYLGRYTHRVAISNHRLLSLKDGNVTFSWKDYARGNLLRPMTLKADQFIGRFLLHVLPRGFQRIRQFGLLANRGRRDKLALCRNLLGHEVENSISIQPLPRDYKALYQSLTGQSLGLCPACRTGTMKLTEYLAPSSRVANAAWQSQTTPLPQAIDSS